MTVRDLSYLTERVLHTPTKPVEKFDDELQQLIDDMIETMYEAKGVGLAAPQIGLSLRLAVIDVSRNNSQPLVLINPEIVEREGEAKLSEGCLSIPGVYEKVPRATRVVLKALDRDGKPYELEADGLLGHAIQHECDHLDGILNIHRLSTLKQKRARDKFLKYMRQHKPS